MNFEHDDDFLRVARMILEGKKPPEKDKKGDSKGDAEKTLDKVKKDIGDSSIGQDKDNKAAQADDDKALDPKDGSGHDGDTSEHPDDPDETGDAEPSQDKESGREPGKKAPKKLDMSKDPFKGSRDKKGGDAKGSDDKPGDGKGDRKPGDSAAKPKFNDDGKDDGGDNEDTDSKDGGQSGDYDASGSDSGKMDGDNAHGNEDGDEDSEQANNKSDGAGDGKDKGGKEVGKEDPEGDHETDNESGESPGEVVDGSSQSEINLTPKIEDEEISEDLMPHESRNHMWGYHGEAYRHHGWEAAPLRYKKMHSHIKKLTGSGDVKTRHYLDSKHGRHLHDSEVSGKATDEHIKKDFGKFSRSYKPEHHLEWEQMHMREEKESAMTFVEKARAARYRMKALQESRVKTDDMEEIEAALNEGLPNTIPGEWYLEGDQYHVAVMTEEGLKDFVFEKHIGFKKLEGELSHEKGVKNPGALAAWIGDRKYGKKKMAKASKEHKPL